MSTSAVYSPHQPSSSTLPTTSESTVLTSTRYSRGRSASNLQRANSSSPPPRPKLTRAQRSQSTKEQSPDKMSASSSRASAAHASASDDAVEAQVALDTGLDTNKQNDDDDRMDADEEGEPELDNLDHDIEPETADSPVAGNESGMEETPDPPAESAVPHQKIMLVIARKRKVDDDTTTVSSEVGLDTPANAATPGTSDLPGAEESAGEAVGDDDKPPAKAPSAASEGVHATDATAATSTSTTDAEAEAAATAAAVAAAAAAAEAEAAKPRRAPRKRRKWLRKGEVDPDDPKAVAEQKARHALIDAALVALDEQENLVLDGTHPTLIALWEELDRRRDLLRSRLDTEIELELEELEGFRKERINQTHFQFHADCEDLALELMFENRRKMSRLVAEKTYLDRHKASTKRKYTNMPTLGEGRGSGGWPVPTSKLLSNGTEPTVETFVDGESRERRDIVLGVKPIAEDDLEDDMIRMGLIEPRPEKIRSSPEPAVRPLVYAEAELPPRSWSRPPTQDPAYAPNKAPFARQPSSTTAPAYPDNKSYSTAEPVYRRPSPPQVAAAVASAPPPPPQLGRPRDFDVYRQRSSDNVEPEREILPAPRLFDRPPAPRHPGPFDAPPPHWINDPRDPRAEPPLAPPPRADPRDIRADLRDPRADQRVDPRVDPRADHHIDPRVDPRVDPRGDPRDLRHEPLADPRNLRGDPRDPRGAPPPPSRYDDPPGGWWGSSRPVPPPVPFHERSHSGRFAPPPPPPPAAGLGSARHPPPPPLPSSGGPPAGDPYFWRNDWNGGAPPPRDYYARDRYGHPPPPDQGRMYPQGSSTPAAYATSRGP
ncbi:uncharacterized protein LOC62_01G000734 [Vanrija pseudolonga]|nr:hypothetical protein LOC62_01G000734 [Vanrija pseudolonga]